MEWVKDVRRRLLRGGGGVGWETFKVIRLCWYLWEHMERAGFYGTCVTCEIVFYPLFVTVPYAVEPGPAV